MTSLDLNSFVTFGYLGVFLVALLAQAVGGGSLWLRRLVWAALILVWGVHTASIGLRWVESYQMGIGHAPLSNLYESLVFFAWAIGLALIIAHYRFRAGVILLVGLPMTVLVMAYTSLLDPEIKPLIPALQSNWLVAHVITCFLGYAGFAVSFVAAILLLLANSSSSAAKHLPATRVLDEIIYKSVLVALPMLTLGIVTGAAWADYAWGSYWSWDPKETWSLITWLVYSAFLHARLARGWSGARAAMLSVIGFGAVMFTYFGVNYLPGLHSYF